MRVLKNIFKEKDPALAYIAMCSRKKSPGVFNKINGTVNGAKSCGYNSRSIIIEPGHAGKYLLFLYKITFAKEKYVFIRYINRIGLFIFIAGMIIRIRRRKLYIDIPTPIQHHLREIFIHGKITWIKLLDAFLMVIQGSLPFLSATKIIQHGEESRWFSSGVRSKTIKIGNGVDVSSVPCRNSAPILMGHCLNLVAVGTVASWHGWDRMIKAIKVIKDAAQTGFDVKFKIIGEGPDLERLKQLVLSYNLSDNVFFSGLLYGDDLYNEYKIAHYGVDSLGWDRVSAYEASSIKVREYLAAGMPVITATKDPDFSGDESFLMTVPSNEDINCIAALLKKIYFMPVPQPRECRLFAENKLDFKVKMRSILPQF